MRREVGDAYIFPAMLEMMAGVGHSWEAVSCLKLGASVRGSNA